MKTKLLLRERQWGAIFSN